MNDLRVVSLRLPAPIHEWLKQVAADSRRSVNSELVVRLERARQHEQREALEKLESQKR